MAITLFAEEMLLLKCIFFNEQIWIFIKISLKFAGGLSNCELG